jgi:rhamnogalacturonyl hydrolase YesR
MLMLGLAQARKVMKLWDDSQLIEEIDAAFSKHLVLWKDKYGQKIDYIDDALSGAALLMLYEALPEGELKERCKDGADKIYEYLVKAPRDAEGTIVYNAERSSCNVFADGIGQVSMFLASYGRVFGDDQAKSLAALQLLNFKKHGMDERSGLPYHGYSLEFKTSGDGTDLVSCEKKGVLSWGRAAGWLIMGLSEYVSCFGKENSEIYEWYKEMAKALLTYQKPDGGYGWQVQAVDGHIDTSASGMILYGLLNGNKAAASVDEVASTIGAFERNTKDGKVSGALSSCDDFGVHYQTYGNYPWGQGAVTLAFSRYCFSR